jgi:CRISPR-associated protein Csx14
MAQASIPVDPLNPGQVFACLGFMEVANILLGDTDGGFDWADGPMRFHLSAAGTENPVEAVLRFLAGAEVMTSAPAKSGLSTQGWHVPTVLLSHGAAFPFPEPDSPATLPITLTHQGVSIAVEHWGDATERDNVKFWAGAGGYPGAALARDALQLVRACASLPVGDPFSFAAPQASSFRFDWRRDYVPMEAGFSPNDHGRMVMLGFPLVEVLAAIGLSHARPLRLTKLLYRYGVAMTDTSGGVLPPMLLRAALGAVPVGLPTRTFEMRLDWPGQENQARCIVETKEITP